MPPNSILTDLSSHVMKVNSTGSTNYQLTDYFMRVKDSGHKKKKRTKLLAYDRLDLIAEVKAQRR